MANSSKPMASEDANQTLRFAFDPATRTISTSSFVNAKIGHKITVTAFSSSADDYSYFDGATLLSTVRVSYTDSTKATLLSVERIA